MNITAEMIKPKVSRQSDFFSWRLYGFLRKYGPCMSNIYISNWNSFSGYEPIKSADLLTTNGVLMIGRKEDSGWFGGRYLRGLCSGPSSGSYQCMGYSHAHHVEDWIDVTEEFWKLYLKIGVCAIHRDNAHNFIFDSDDVRHCEYCGKQYFRHIEMVPTERWKARSGK